MPMLHLNRYGGAPKLHSAVESTFSAVWNAAGAERGLLPLSWHLADPWSGAHFAASAAGHPEQHRREIVESWIVQLGLVDEVDPLTEPLKRCGDEMVWTGSVDGVTFQLTYPAEGTTWWSSPGDAASPAA
ncbi:hypothetical protein [Clavibacter tessellarius]|uniref:hypothetical protein n=1 Tax=Clavibacter tessellarius TaxID=31965 RepID=UPI0039E98652